jgi:putative DNA primase/helicase
MGVMDDRTKLRYRPLSGAELSGDIPIDENSDAPQDDVVLISPVPIEAPELPATHPTYGSPAGGWAYRDAAGAILYWVFRFDPPGIRKQFSPLTLWRKGERLFWEWKNVPAPRPLYALDKLAERPNADVVLCEGEKAADAAAVLLPGYVATCSSNGSGAAKQTDWSPLAGRRVLIWPDADEPGDQYERDVKQILNELGCQISIINGRTLAGLNPGGGNREPEVGWDAGNAFDEWTDVKALREAIEANTKPFYPGPAYISWSNFTMTASGLTAEVTTGKGDSAVTEDVWIASALEIIGASRDPTGHGWGKWIRYRDADQRLHTRHVPDSALQGIPAALCGMLADAGLRIDRTQQRLLATYLSGVEVRGRVTRVERTGWHEIGGQKVFVLPDNTISANRTESVVLDSSAAGPYETRGTLENWQRGIGVLARGHALPVLAVSAAFAGPLLHLAGQEGGGINIFGVSSKGKTTLLQIAASVWGRGDSSGYVRAWRTTANGLEGVAASATDTALVLDALGIIDARDAGPSLYSLSNGVGKNRARRDGSLRNPRNWRVLVISSGEIPIETKLAEDRGRKPRAGQLVRMLDIPGDRGLGFGVFDNAGSAKDAAELAQSFKSAAVSAYGTAGPAFVRRIVDEESQEVGTIVRKMVEMFVSRHAPENSDGQVIRAAQRFGLIAAAGELATQLGITPWEPNAATVAAKWAFDAWMAQRGGKEPAEVRQAIEQVRLYVERHGESRFEDVNGDAMTIVNNRAGWRTGRGQDREWWVAPQVWKSEICAGLDPKLVAKTLAERGFLRRAQDGYQPVVKIAGQSRRVYVLLAELIAGGYDAG